MLALQGDIDEHLAMLERAGATAVRVRRPAELERIDGLVIPGGESTTIGKLADIFELTEPLRGRLAAGMPAYGTCAGMILLADRIKAGTAGQLSFGGIDMVCRRNAFGRQVDSFECDLDLVGIDGPPYHAVFIRAPWAESVGAGVEVLGRVDGGPADGRIVAVRQGALLATAFHPEMTGDVRPHEMFVQMVRGETKRRGTQ